MRVGIGSAGPLRGREADFVGDSPGSRCLMIDMMMPCSPLFVSGCRLLTATPGGARLGKGRTSRSVACEIREVVGAHQSSLTESTLPVLLSHGGGDIPSRTMELMLEHSIGEGAPAVWQVFGRSRYLKRRHDRAVGSERRGTQGASCHLSRTAPSTRLSGRTFNYPHHISSFFTYMWHVKQTIP